MIILTQNTGTGTDNKQMITFKWEKEREHLCIARIVNNDARDDEKQIKSITSQFVHNKLDVY